MSILESLQQAVARRPVDIYLRTGLASALADDGQFNEALEQLMSATKLASGEQERADVVRAFNEVLAMWSQSNSAHDQYPLDPSVSPSTGGPSDAQAEPTAPTGVDRVEKPDAEPVRGTERLTSSGAADGAKAEWPEHEAVRSDVTLADVAGLDDVKRHLDVKVFAPLRNPVLARQFGRLPHGGLLLWGPPGCGKTFVARALAGSLDVSFVTAGLNEILGMYMGDTEKGMSALFTAARGAAPAVLFIDEFDALGGQRSQMGFNRGYRSLVSSLLVEMDGIGSDNDGLFTIGATNMPWDVDSALRRPGRFDRTVFVPPPDEQARTALLAAALASVPLADDVNVIQIAESLRGRSGADVRLVAERAIDSAFARSVDASATMPVSQEDIVRAVRATGSSIESWVVQARVVGEASNDTEMFEPFFTWLDTR